MRILFLDFDGVIRVATQGGWVTDDDCQFCGERIKRVAWCCRELGAQVVVSSDWRNMENRGEIEKLLGSRLGGLLHDDWMTPITGHRWNEIQAWLVRHPEVTEYVILDDFAQHFTAAPQAMRDRLVLCSSRHGFVPELVPRVMEMFAPASSAEN